MYLPLSDAKHCTMTQSDAIIQIGEAGGQLASTGTRKEKKSVRKWAPGGSLSASVTNDVARFSLNQVILSLKCKSMYECTFVSHCFVS